jgi:hypothetical protein
MKPEILSFFDELQKLGAISDEQAQHSLDRLETLEKNRSTVGQAARYGAVGAIAAPAIKAVGRAIEGGKKTGLRGIAADAATGALGGSILPMARNALDRHSEKRTLKKYLHENQ